MSDLNRDAFPAIRQDDVPTAVQPMLFEAEDPASRMLGYIEQMLAGGTIEAGRGVSEGILGRLATGRPLKHMLIIQGEGDRDREIRASDIPFNKGLLQGFGMKPEGIDQVISGKYMKMGKSGVIAFMQPLWHPRHELTVAECDGLKKRLYNGAGERTESGIVIFPTFAIRAVFQGIATTDPEMQINEVPEV